MLHTLRLSDGRGMVRPVLGAAFAEGPQLIRSTADARFMSHQFSLSLFIPVPTTADTDLGFHPVRTIDSGASGKAAWIGLGADVSGGDAPDAEGLPPQCLHVDAIASVCEGAIIQSSRTPSSALAPESSNYLHLAVSNRTALHRHALDSTCWLGPRLPTRRS